MSTPFHKLDLAERAERLALEVYESFSDQFKEDKITSYFFKRLALEEEQHALRVMTLRKHFIHGRVQELHLDVTKLAACIEKTEELLIRIESNEFSTAEECMEAALQMENDLAEAHAHMLLSETDMYVRDFFRSLATQDSAHSTLLAQLKDRK